MGLTTVYTWMGETGKAEPYARRAVALRERSIRETDERLVIPLQNLAVVLQTEHRFAEAREYYNRALAILKATGQQNDISAALIHGNLGKLLVRMNRPDEAIQELKMAVAIGDSSPGTTPLPFIEFRTSLGEAYGKARRSQDAY